MVGLTAQLSNPEFSVPMAEARRRRASQIMPVRQRQTRLVKSEVADLVCDRSKGATILELATRYGVHRTTVIAHLQRHVRRVD